MENNQPKNFEAYRIVFIVIGIAALAAFAHSMKEAFAAVTISLVLFYILDPIATFFTGRRIGRRLKIPRLGGVAIAAVAGLLAFTLFLIILIPPIYEQVERLIANLPDYTKKAEETFRYLQSRYERLQLPEEAQNSIYGTLERGVSESSVLVKHAVKGLQDFFSQIVLLFMIPFITFYLLLEKDDVKAAFVRVFPKRHQEEMREVVSQSSHALRGYIAGQLLLSVIMGVAITILLGAMGVKAPLLLGLIAGVTKLIPVIGIFLGCIPAAFVALSTSTNLAVAVVVIFTVVQLLENKLVLPLLLSRYVNLSPLTILCALIVGEQLGGVLGMFISTPIVAVLKVVYTHVRAKYE